ncbi:MAG: carboxymuconolactone decarboxylase family protein [Bdellovibrionales bacterium]
MRLEELKSRIPDSGRDIRLNLEAVLTPEGAPGLTPRQIWGVSLACAFALGSQELVEVVRTESAAVLDDATLEGARAAVTIMAMNNVYYRSIHLLEDAELKRLPTRLRMNVIARPGIEKVEFELMAFAISSLAGCGQCLIAHMKALRTAGVGDEGIQSALRIAAVLSGAHRALAIAAIG